MTEIMKLPVTMHRDKMAGMWSNARLFPVA